MVAQAILRLCETNHLHLLPQFIPGRLNVLADSLSRRSQVLGSEWTLCCQGSQEVLCRWPATIDLCDGSESQASSLLLADVRPSVGGHRCHDAVLGRPSGLLLSPLRGAPLGPCQGQAIAGVGPHPNSSILDSTPVVSRPAGTSGRGSSLPSTGEGFTQTTALPLLSPEPTVLRLTAFRLSSDLRDISASLQRWLVNLPTVYGLPPVETTRRNGQFIMCGVNVMVIPSVGRLFLRLLRSSSIYVVLFPFPTLPLPPIAPC